MTVDHVRGDEEPAALDRSGYHFDDINRPGAPSQPSLRGGIAQVEMDPHKIRAARRGIGLRKIIQRPSQPADKDEGKERMIVTLALPRTIAIERINIDNTNRRRYHLRLHRRPSSPYAPPIAGA